MNQKQNLGGEVDEELVTTTFVGNFYLQNGSIKHRAK